MATRDPIIEELRRKVAAKVLPECIDREIIKVLQTVIANLQAERFRLQRAVRILLEEKGVKDPDRVVASITCAKSNATEH